MLVSRASAAVSLKGQPGSDKAAYARIGIQSRAPVIIK